MVLKSLLVANFKSTVGIPEIAVPVYTPTTLPISFAKGMAIPNPNVKCTPYLYWYIPGWMIDLIYNGVMRLIVPGDETTYIHVCMYTYVLWIIRIQRLGWPLANEGHPDTFCRGFS